MTPVHYSKNSRILTEKLRAPARAWRARQQKRAVNPRCAGGEDNGTINRCPLINHGLIALTVQFAMMKPTDWNRIFVADLSAERARLGKANMADFARRPAADEADLRRHIFAVLFVTQTNRLDGSAPRGRRWLVA